MAIPERRELQIVDWLRNQAIQLTSLDPKQINKDMQPLKSVIGNARLVGLGEQTHGNKEFALVRHRVFRFLVEEMGFGGLVMEVEEVPARKMDKYVKTGEGDPHKILADIGYGFVFNTQEVFDLVQWMREYNQNNSAQLTFKGCDIKQTGQETLNERDELMARNTFRFLDEVEEEGKLALWAHNSHIASKNTSKYAYFEDWKPLGEYLRERLGHAYLNFATFCNEGLVNGVKANFEKEPFEFEYNNIIQGVIPKAPTGSYEYFFAKTQVPVGIVDLRPVKEFAFFKSWRTSPLIERTLGFAFDPRYDNPMEEDKQVIGGRYDAVIWIDKVTPSTVLPLKLIN